MNINRMGMLQVWFVLILAYLLIANGRQTVRVVNSLTSAGRGLTQDLQGRSKVL